MAKVQGNLFPLLRGEWGLEDAGILRMSGCQDWKDIDEYSKAQIKPADLPLHGYMPLRGDCDVEYKDTAEDLLAEMELPPIEDIAGRSLKRQILRLYNGKLQERENRRCFFIKRGLYGTASHHGQKRSRAFARLDEVGGRKLMEGVVQSTRLRERLVQLASQCS